MQRSHFPAHLALQLRNKTPFLASETFSTKPYNSYLGDAACQDPCLPRVQKASYLPFASIMLRVSQAIPPFHLPARRPPTIFFLSSSPHFKSFLLLCISFFQFLSFFISFDSSLFFAFLTYLFIINLIYSFLLLSSPFLII